MGGDGPSFKEAADAWVADILKDKEAVGKKFGGVVYKNDGGSIFQPKGTDTVPAMLTPGEFVVRKSAVDKIGAANLSALNDGNATVYRAEGGIVGMPRGSAVSSNAIAAISQIGMPGIKKALVEGGFKGDDLQQIMRDLAHLRRGGRLDISKFEGIQELGLLFDEYNEAASIIESLDAGLGFNMKPFVANNIDKLKEVLSSPPDRLPPFGPDKVVVWNPRKKLPEIKSISSQLVARGTTAATTALNAGKASSNMKMIKFAASVLEQGGFLDKAPNNFPEGWIDERKTQLLSFASEQNDLAKMIDKELAVIAAYNPSAYAKLPKRDDGGIDFTTGEYKAFAKTSADARAAYAEIQKMFGFNVDRFEENFGEPRLNIPEMEQQKEILEERQKQNEVDQAGEGLNRTQKKALERLIDKEVLRLAEGGQANSANLDSIPAMLTPGEFVMSPESVQKYGVGFMKQLNRGKIPGFRRGGLVGQPAYLHKGGTPEGGSLSISLDTTALQSTLDTFGNAFRESLDTIATKFSGISTSLDGLAGALSQPFVMEHKFSGDMKMAFSIDNEDHIKNAVAESITPTLMQKIGDAIDQKFNEFRSQ